MSANTKSNIIKTLNGYYLSVFITDLSMVDTLIINTSFYLLFQLLTARN